MIKHNHISNRVPPSKVMHKYLGTHVEKIHIWVKEMLFILSKCMIKGMEVPTKEEINQGHLAKKIANWDRDRDSKGRKF